MVVTELRTFELTPEDEERRLQEMIAAANEFRKKCDALLDPSGLLLGEENKAVRNRAYVLMDVYGIPPEERIADVARAARSFEESLNAKGRGDEQEATFHRLEYWQSMMICYPERCRPENAPSEIGWMNAKPKG